MRGGLGYRNVIEDHRDLLLFFLLVVLIVMSHPFASPWYDENYSLYNFILRGPGWFLFDYHQPNNHILYSLGQWAWRFVVGDDVFANRLFPLLCTALAIPGLYIAGEKLHSKLAGIFAVLFFSTSHVVSNFATQLRGYGLSLGLISLALGGACAWWRGGYKNTLFGICYAVTGALAVGVVPTNAIFIAVIGAWLVLQNAFSANRNFSKVCLVSVLPVLGMLFYVPVWDQFIAVAKYGEWYSYTDFIVEFFVESFVIDLPWLIVIIGLGLWSTRDSALRRTTLQLLILCVLTFGIPLVSNVPWPRNYLPILPIVMLVAAISMADLLSRVPKNKLNVYSVAAFILILVFVGIRELGLSLLSSKYSKDDVGRQMTLLNQYNLSPNYNDREIQDFFSGVEESSLLVMRDEVAWDIAHVLKRGYPIVKSQVICTLKREMKCNANNVADGKITKVYLVDHDSRQLERFQVILTRGFKLPQPITFEPNVVSKQFKVWSGDVSLKIGASGGV